MTPFESIKAFYQTHLPGAAWKGSRLTAPCPFCLGKKMTAPGQLVVFLNPDSYFRGYFRCSNGCVTGGFHTYFGRLMEIDADRVPGHDPEHEPYAVQGHYPSRHLGKELDQFTALMGQTQYEHFARFGISQAVVKQMGVGFNGRYLVYPYIQESGQAYAAHCLLPGSTQDHFWHGNDAFAAGEFALYNAEQIQRCEGGALFITDGELNLLILHELGYPAIAVPSAAELVNIAPMRLARIDHIFLIVTHSPEARAAARNLAVGLGFKARILTWPAYVKRGEHLAELVADHGQDAAPAIRTMLSQSTAFSPFGSPDKESQKLAEFLDSEQGKPLLGMQTGFVKLDHHMEGLRGINILGGPPKAGKSCFFMQISTEVARRKMPVIYYDFENGRLKIYLRTLVRLSRLAEKKIRTGNLANEETAVLELAMAELRRLLYYFRVVTDRQLTPDMVRRHIDFIQHETRQGQVLVVVDSLHKLPFKNLTERRTGIDSWLRYLEAIRDEQQACFLVISELSRGKGGGYGEKPDLGSFKESGDIEYSADNAMVLMPDWDPLDPVAAGPRKSLLWMVASRESSPGRVAEYALDFPYWQFKEL